MERRQWEERGSSGFVLAGIFYGLLSHQNILPGAPSEETARKSPPIILWVGPKQNCGSAESTPSLTPQLCEKASKCLSLLMPGNTRRLEADPLLNFQT